MELLAALAEHVHRAYRRAADHHQHGVRVPVGVFLKNRCGLGWPMRRGRLHRSSAWRISTSELFVGPFSTHANRVAWRICGCRRHPQCKPRSTWKLQFVPADGHQRCQWVNGNVGLSPFYGQPSGKPLLASAWPYIGARIYFATKVVVVVLNAGRIACWVRCQSTS